MTNLLSAERLRKQEMRVSTVIPTYNRASYIKRALDSVVAQTVPVDEIIIVDDVRSTDHIEETVAALYGDRVRVVKETGGLSGARRRCVREARGEWIAFLDSDDLWTPERNQQFLEATARVPEDVAWIFGDMRVVTDQGDSTTLFGEYGLTVKESPQVFSDSLSVQYPFMFSLVQASFIRRKVLSQLDCFKEGLQSSEDLLAAFQVACRYRFAAIPAVIGRRILTSDLAATSASVAGVLGPDYFRARVLAFAEVVQSGRRRPWTHRYAEEVRGLCCALARRGPVPRFLAFQQFRFGTVSFKALAFCCLSALGRKGLHFWSLMSALRGEREGKRPKVAEQKLGHRGWAQSLRERAVLTGSSRTTSG